MPLNTDAAYDLLVHQLVQEVLSVIEMENCGVDEALKDSEMWSILRRTPKGERRLVIPSLVKALAEHVSSQEVLMKALEWFVQRSDLSASLRQEIRRLGETVPLRPVLQLAIREHSGDAQAQTDERNDSSSLPTYSGTNPSTRWKSNLLTLRTDSAITAVQSYLGAIKTPKDLHRIQSEPAQLSQLKSALWAIALWQIPNAAREILRLASLTIRLDSSLKSRSIQRTAATALASGVLNRSATECLSLMVPYLAEDVWSAIRAPFDEFLSSNELYLDQLQISALANLDEPAKVLLTNWLDQQLTLGDHLPYSDLLRLIESPVAGPNAQSMIWKIDGKALLLHQGRWLRSDGTEAHPVPEQLGSARCTLWHPIEALPDSVAEWRGTLSSLQIEQAIKQAFRETYSIAESQGELENSTLRFAGMVLNQMQFGVLARRRGWTAELCRWNTPGILRARKAPHAGLSASFEYVEFHARELHNRIGASHYITTGALEFWEGDKIVPIREVAPRILSEIMRDVDFFVAVAGVGNDPEWNADSIQPDLFHQWLHLSLEQFLSSDAERAELLAAALKPLKIANQCKLERHFLVVEGTWNTYRIHFRSGSVFKSPADQYVCTGAWQTPPSLFGEILPFISDYFLMVLLEKAIFFAHDSEISDPAILRQIRPMLGGIG